MSVALLVITDGRDDYLARCLDSVDQRLTGLIVERWMFDDSGDAAHRDYLAEAYPNLRHINVGRRQGFGGAIRAAWKFLSVASQTDWVFHLEADFLFNRTVDLGELAHVLAPRPYLLQMALRRQAWSTAERLAGGVVEQHPEAYEAHRDALGHPWLEHRLFWTTNPALYRRSMCDLTWPLGGQSEGRFARNLLDQGVPGVKPADVRFGYWGAASDPPWVEHIGAVRAGEGY